MNVPVSRSFWRIESAAALLLITAVGAAIFFASRGLLDESALSMHGDMPRHMMNGVFLWDFLRTGSFLSVDGALTFAKEYFVRYPALSLGHHPPLLAGLLVPFYAVFGVSVFSARLAVVACMVVAVLALFSLTRRLYGDVPAGWASLLFATHPFIVPYGQQVMSEAPTVALVLLACDALVRFCDTPRTSSYWAFVVLGVASLYAKQLAIFMFPLWALTLCARVPLSRLLRRDVLLATACGAVLVVPIVLATLVLSPYNVALVAQASSSGAGVAAARNIILPNLFESQLSWPLLAAVVAAVIAAVFARDRRIFFVAGWMVSVVGSVVVLLGPFEFARYSILAIPAYCLCAATLAGRGPSVVRAIAAVTLVTAAGWQGWLARDSRPVGAAGYEAAARYVTGRIQSPTVLYSAAIDTGYFVFFVRKHDPDARQVILRSDKILTTSMMGHLSVEDRIERPEQIYPLLQSYGTRYVVIEDRETDSDVLNWLRDEVRGPEFEERKRFPLQSRDRRLRNVDVVVYEYLHAGPPNPAAEIDVGIPLIGRDIHLRLSDLLPAQPAH